jgi:primosomal protein N' (replication factor Y)
MPNFAVQESFAPEYVEVALPLPLRQTFTYRLPFGLRETVKIGARLLVPFGKRHLTGYAVALHRELSEEIEFEESAIKEAAELVDEEPLITEEILRLTQWTADYYASAWGEVLKASLPAGINAGVEQIVSMTTKGRDELIKTSSATTAKSQILAYLAENGETAARELASKFGTTQAQRAVRELIKNGWAASFQRTITAQVKLAKRGFLEISVQEVQRDPFSDSKLPEITNLILTDEQSTVLNEIENALDAENTKRFCFTA